MAGAQTTLSLQDKLTGPLMKMMRAMDRTIAIMERMDQTANSVDTRGLQRARSDIQNASADLERLRSSTSSTDRLSEGFRRIRSPVESAAGAVKNFFSSFVGAAAAYLSLQGLANGFKKFVGASDTMTSTTARLNLINDGLQTQAELQDKIYNAAQRSLTPYNVMADSVAKLNLLAGHAFSGNDETILFSELMGKALSVSGADTQARQAATRQLTQAMSSGRLQGDEYVSIIENAPLLAKAIEKAMGQGEGSLKKLSSEGKITSAVIKSALFSAGTEIEEMFASLPLTFADAMVLFKNWSGRAFEPLFIRFNQFVNSDAFQVLAGHAMGFVAVFVAAMSIMFDVIEGIYGAIGAVSEYWPVMAAGLAVLIAVYFPVIMGWLSSMSVKLWLLVQPVLAQAAAWLAVYWPIALIIGIVVALIAILMHFGVTTEQILGFVGGLFFALGAVVWNQVANMWNMFAMLAEFLINLFIDPKYAVEKLFYDLTKHVIDNMAAMGGSFDNVTNFLGKAFVAGANVAIGGINGLLKAIAKVTGIDLGEVGKLSAGTSNVLSNSLKNMANNLEAPTSTKNVVNLARMDLKSIPGAYQSGYSKGSNMKLPSFGNAGDKFKVPPNIDTGNVFGDGKLKGGKLDKVGKIDDEISIADEDLKMLRELADIRSIQNFQTLNPTVQFMGDMTIREDADLDKLVAKLTDKLTDQSNESVEGVYT